MALTMASASDLVVKVVWIALSGPLGHLDPVLLTI
jgi:hypothetical protein